jgi:FlaG/FlaF family flagellin (archaellin)
MLARALVIAVVVALAAADHVSLAPGYDYDFQLSNNVGAAASVVWMLSVAVWWWWWWWWRG